LYRWTVFGYATVCRISTRNGVVGGIRRRGGARQLIAGVLRAVTADQLYITSTGAGVDRHQRYMPPGLWFVSAAGGNGKN